MFYATYDAPSGKLTGLTRQKPSGTFLELSETEYVDFMDTPSNIHKFRIKEKEGKPIRKLDVKLSTHTCQLLDINNSSADYSFSLDNNEMVCEFSDTIEDDDLVTLHGMVSNNPLVEVKTLVFSRKQRKIKGQGPLFLVAYTWHISHPVEGKIYTLLQG